TGNPFAVGTHIRRTGITDDAVHQVEIVFAAVSVEHLHGLYLPHVLTDVMHFSGLVPINQTEIEIVPSGTVNNFAVGRNSAGHNPVQLLGARVFFSPVTFGHFQFAGRSVLPNHRPIERTGSVAHVRHGISHRLAADG